VLSTLFIESSAHLLRFYIEGGIEGAKEGRIEVQIKGRFDIEIGKE
jgi:hypothetical protein